MRRATLGGKRRRVDDARNDAGLVALVLGIAGMVGTKARTDPRRYVDSGSVPYLVLPSHVARGGDRFPSLGARM